MATRPRKAEKPRPSEGHVPKAPPYTNYRQSERDDEGYAWVRTSSSNRARPRTQIAGYSPTDRTLRVVFRDGTPYNYYGVEPEIWDRFKRSASPGRFINRVLNSFDYERGDWSPP